MEAVKKKPAPPITGRWKPGQSGNPKGRPDRRLFKQALEHLAMKNKPAIAAAAQALMAKAMTGDVSALKEMADRLDGKVPTIVAGDEDMGPVKLEVQWKK